MQNIPYVFAKIYQSSRQLEISGGGMCPPCPPEYALGSTAGYYGRFSLQLLIHCDGDFGSLFGGGKGVRGGKKIL